MRRLPEGMLAHGDEAVAEERADHAQEVLELPLAHDGENEPHRPGVPWPSKVVTT